MTAFAPTDLANLEGWYKGDALGLSDGASVSSWTDSSGNARHLASGTAPIQKTNIRNGLSIVRFNGSTQFLRINDAAFRSNDWSIFVAFAYGTASQATGEGLVACSNNGTGIGYNFYRGSGPKHRIGVDGSAFSTAGGNDIVNGTWYVGGFDHNESTTTSNLWISNSSTASVTSSSSTNTWGVQTPQFCVGRQYSDAFSVSGGASDMGEVIFYSRQLSASDRAQVMNYLAGKWAIAVPVVLSPLFAGATWTANDPTLVAASTLAPSTAAAAWAALDPTLVAGGVVLSPSVANAAWSAFDPTLTPGGVSLAPSLAPGTWSAEDPNLLAGGITFELDPATSDWDALDPDLSPGGLTFTPNIATGSWSANDPDVSAGGVAAAPSVATSAWEALDPVLVHGAPVGQVDALYIRMQDLTPAVAMKDLTPAVTFKNLTPSVTRKNLTPKVSLKDLS